MKKWFTNYRGSAWDSNTARKSYTKFFGDEVVRPVRDWFHLEKTGTGGLEKGTGVPRIYNDLGVYVTVSDFVWNQFVEVEGEMQPLLKLKLKIQRVGTHEVLFNCFIEITFDGSFPEKPPRVRVDMLKYKTFMGNSHAHHMYSGGWVCFYAGYNDWDSKQTIVSFIQATFNWMVWHYDKFGW